MSIAEEILNVERELSRLKPRAERWVIVQRRFVMLKVKQIKAELRAEKRKAA